MKRFALLGWLIASLFFTEHTALADGIKLKQGDGFTIYANPSGSLINAIAISSASGAPVVIGPSAGQGKHEIFGTLVSHRNSAAGTGGDGLFSSEGPTQIGSNYYYNSGLKRIVSGGMSRFVTSAVTADSSVAFLFDVDTANSAADTAASFATRMTMLGDGTTDFTGAATSGQNYLTSAGVRLLSGSSSTTTVQQHTTSSTQQSTFMFSTASGQDSGTTPVGRFDSRVITNSTTAAGVTTRPLFAFTNNGTTKAFIPNANSGQGAFAVGTIATNVGIYQASQNSTNSTCTTLCQNAESANNFNSISGACLGGWKTDGTVRGCSDTTLENKTCLCMGMN